jgi:hypothetical protein
LIAAAAPLRSPSTTTLSIQNPHWRPHPQQLGKGGGRDLFSSTMAGAREPPSAGVLHRRALALGAALREDVPLLDTHLTTGCCCSQDPFQPPPQADEVSTTMARPSPFFGEQQELCL